MAGESIGTNIALRQDNSFIRLWNELIDNYQMMQM